MSYVVLAVTVVCGWVINSVDSVFDNFAVTAPPLSHLMGRPFKLRSLALLLAIVKFPVDTKCSLSDV